MQVIIYVNMYANIGAIMEILKQMCDDNLVHNYLKISFYDDDNLDHYVGQLFPTLNWRPFESYQRSKTTSNYSISCKFIILIWQNPRINIKDHELV